MKKKYTQVVGEHELSILYDKEFILWKIEEERKVFTEESSQRYGFIGVYDEFLNQEDYERNLDEMILQLEVITTEESLAAFLLDAPKNKKGTFQKDSVVFQIGCDNADYTSIWQNTWIYNALNVSVKDEKTLLLDYISIIDTPN